MVVLEAGLLSQPQRAQSGGEGVVGRSQQRAAQQRLRAQPTGFSKQRGKRRQHGAHLRGRSKHKGGSLWSVNPPNLLPRRPFRNWPKSSLGPLGGIFPSLVGTAPWQTLQLQATQPEAAPSSLWALCS